MRRRVLQVIATLDRSGAEKHLALLASRLPRDEFDVHVCALVHGGPFADELRAAGIPVEVLDKRWKYDPLAWFRLRQHIARLKPDLVHTWMFTANAYGRTAARSAGVKHLLASERCVDTWKSGYQFMLDRRLAKTTDAIVVNSRGVQEFYRQQGLPEDKLRLIYNGVGLAEPSATSHEEFLREFNLPANARVIGTVSRLWPQKRLKDLIWATDLIKVIRDDVHLLVIGDGPQRDDLERFSELCAVDDKVHFLGQRNDVPRLMPHFDLLWLASGFEGLPNVVMEAMAAGIPVVATDIAGTQELVVSGETGFLVPLGDRAELARGAYKILEDPALQARLGEAGRARIQSEFTIDQMVERHAALYREVLG